jgi:hypothetical protein
MDKDQIKMSAEKIWQKLEKDLTDTNIDKLRKDFGLNSNELGAALGWLAKEDKITFISYGDKTTYVFPVE